MIDSIGSHVTDVANSLETTLPSAVSRLGGAANTAVDSIETAIPEVISQVRSAANAVATAVPAAIEAILPRNCSIGTNQFCIGRADSVLCYNLPPNISGIIPLEIRNSLGEDFSSIQVFDIALTKITTRTIQDIWIAGLVLIFLILCSTLFSIFRSTFFQLRVWRVVFHLVFGLIFCIPFIITVVTLHILHSKLSSLPNWIQIVQGDLMGLFIGGLCCAVTLVAFCAGLLAIV